MIQAPHQEVRQYYEKFKEEPWDSLEKKALPGLVITGKALQLFVPFEVVPQDLNKLSCLFDNEKEKEQFKKELKNIKATLDLVKTVYPGLDRSKFDGIINDYLESVKHIPLTYSEAKQPLQEPPSVLNLDSRKSLDEFKTEFQNIDMKYKLENMKSKGYYTMRGVRGDGNCYYRALYFQYLERVVKNGPKSIKALIARLEKRQSYWGLKEYTPEAQLGIDEHILPRLKQLFNESVKYVNLPESSRAPLGLLMQIVLSDLEFDLSCIRMLRGMVEKFMKINDDFVFGEVPMNVAVYATSSGGVETQDIDGYIKHIVHPMGEEAQNVIMNIIPLILRLQVQTIMLNTRNPQGEKENYIEKYSSKQTQLNLKCQDELDSLEDEEITLFFRPGHYDIVYKRDFVDYETQKIRKLVEIIKTNRVKDQQEKERKTAKLETNMMTPCCGIPIDRDAYLLELVNNLKKYIIDYKIHNKANWKISCHLCDNLLTLDILARSVDERTVDQIYTQVSMAVEQAKKEEEELEARRRQEELEFPTIRTTCCYKTIDKEVYLNSLKQEQLEKLKTKYSYHQYIRISCPMCKKILYLTDLERMFKPETYQSLLALYKPEQSGICDSCTYPVYKDYFFTLNCGHHFHFNCLKADLKKSERCKKCQLQIPNEVNQAIERGTFDIIYLPPPPKPQIVTKSETLSDKCSYCGGSSGEEIHYFSCSHNLHSGCIKGSRCPICEKDLGRELEEIKESKKAPPIYYLGEGEGRLAYPEEVNTPGMIAHHPPAYSAPPQAAMGHVQDPQPITGAGGSMVFGRPEKAGGAPVPSNPLAPQTKPLGYGENEGQEITPQGNPPTSATNQITLKCGHQIDYGAINDYANKNISVTAFNGQTLQFVGCSTCGQPMTEDDMRYILGTNFGAIVRRDLAYYCTHCNNPLYDSRVPQHVLSCGHKICPRCLESAAQTNKIHYSAENDSAIVPCDICTNIYHSPNNPYLDIISLKCGCQIRHTIQLNFTYQNVGRELFKLDAQHADNPQCCKCHKPMELIDCHIIFGQQTFEQKQKRLEDYLMVATAKHGGGGEERKEARCPNCGKSTPHKMSMYPICQHSMCVDCFDNRAPCKQCASRPSVAPIVVAQGQGGLKCRYCGTTQNTIREYSMCLCNIVCGNHFFSNLSQYPNDADMLGYPAMCPVCHVSPLNEAFVNLILGNLKQYRPPTSTIIITFQQFMESTFDLNNMNCVSCNGKCIRITAKTGVYKHCCTSCGKQF